MAGGVGRVVVQGTGLDTLDLEALFHLAFAPAPQATDELLTRADLSPEEISSLRDAHKNDPLPHGWFYDGSMFVDFDGNRKAEHPDLPSIICRHLEVRNRHDSEQTTVSVAPFPGERVKD
ncbi:unnamed protein product [Choristocarpus tenellus]